MLSLRKLSAAVLAGVMCIGCAGMTAYADTEETTEDATEAAASEPEEITSGEYTYYIDEEYGGAVITKYEPQEADVVLPEEIDGVTVAGLDDFLFTQQDGIETVTIPDNLCHIGASAFYGTSISEFIVSDTHPMYKTEDGVLFSKDGIALVAYPPEKTDTSYTVPDGVEELYHGCFAQNLHLKEVNLPDGLIYIDTWAFAYTLLTELDIPDTVTNIGGYAFAYMTRLTEIETPPELQYVSSATFAGCANLNTVTLNNGLLEIGQSAFAGTAVRDIVIPATVTSIGYCALGYDTNLSTSYSTLVIYGLSGSAAQTYATDKDEEYDYENNFTFIAKTEAQLNAMLSGETEADSSETEEVQVIIEEDDDNTNTQNILKIVLIVLVAGVLCGGVAAVAISSKKNKKD
ncbi:MAG: leucine-rich repeat protein [Oscillospiraceae bacterium]|nr:leucine-rich repeat protein [Oscillospiraceae bacterium]